MKLEPSIQIIAPKKLIGMSKEMSLSNDQTGQLFRQFMPRRKEVQNIVNLNYTYDLRVYDPNYFQQFDPSRTFTKWSLVEVSSTQQIPEEMEVFKLESGQYAVFFYKGLSSDRSFFQYIFLEWLPRSAYVLDNRPHFEILSERTKLNDPNSEEEVWIPVKLKNR